MSQATFGSAIAAIGRRIFSKSEKPELVLVKSSGDSSDTDPLSEKAREIDTIIAASEGIVAKVEDLHRSATTELETLESAFAAANDAFNEAARKFESEDTDDNAYTLSVARERVPRARQRRDAAAAKQAEAAEHVRAAHDALNRARASADLIAKLAEVSAERFHAKVAPMAVKMIEALAEAEMWAAQIDIEFHRVNLVAVKIGETPLGAEHLVVDVLRLLADRGATVPARAWRLLREGLTRPIMGDAKAFITQPAIYDATWPRTEQQWFPSLSLGIARGGLGNLFSVIASLKATSDEERNATRADLDLTSESREDAAVELRNQHKRWSDEDELRAKQAREQQARNDEANVKHLTQQRLLQSSSHTPRHVGTSMTGNPGAGWSDK